MNKNLNLEDIQKFTKYYLKINSHVGGGDASKTGVYNQKLNEYSDKLKQSGVDTMALTKIIQEGGGKLSQILEGQAREVLASINNVKETVDKVAMEKVIGEIEGKLATLKQSHDEVKTEFKEYYNASQAAFNEIKKKAQTPGSETKIEPPESLRLLNANLDKDVTDTKAFMDIMFPSSNGSSAVAVDDAV